MQITPQDKNCSVMIVDDSHLTREILRSMLEASGYKVIAEACDGCEAVNKYAEFYPQITIMDVMMPKKGGIDATRDIVSFDKNAKIIMSSTLGLEDLVKSALEAGAMDIIFKPYDIDEVREVFDKVMQF